MKIDKANAVAHLFGVMYKLKLMSITDFYKYIDDLQVRVFSEEANESSKKA